MPYALKLTDDRCRTRGDMQWKLGKWYRKPTLSLTPELCTEAVFHAFPTDNPMVVPLLRSAFVHYHSYRLWVAEYDGQVTVERWKLGATRMRLVEELEFPEVSQELMRRVMALCYMEALDRDETSPSQALHTMVRTGKQLKRTNAPWQLFLGEVGVENVMSVILDYCRSMAALETYVALAQELE